MPLTGISIRLNKSEYSRYEPARSVVKVRVFPVPATGLVTEPVTITVQKKGVAIATQDITLSGDQSKGTIVTFDLTAIADADGISHINRGDYQVVAVQGDVTGTAPFRTAIITADEMRKTYCQGLYLVAGVKLAPKRQPTAVTGVTITNVGNGTKKGIYALIWDAMAQTLSWSGGVAIPIAEDADDAILPDTKGTYIEIEYDFYALPLADAAEGILLDAEEMTDYFIASEIEKATQEVESALKLMLEPTRVATEPFFSNPEPGKYYDQKAVPRTYYEKDFNRRSLGFHIDLPYHQVGKVDNLTGYIGNSMALQLQQGAIAVNRKSGVVDVLPYNSAYVMYWTFFLGINFWGVREFIADFWRYTAVIGIDEKPPAEIIKMVGYTAAISILTAAEQAYRAGITAESISKDGVTRSQSYNSKGVYDTSIQTYKDWIKEKTPEFRKLYRGFSCVVL